MSKKDHTSAILIGMCAVGLLVFAFGVAVEVLKFIALIKWVFG